jgi:hypothetical protein
MQSPKPFVACQPIRLSLAAVAIACSTGGIFGQTALVGNSPFAPSGAAIVQGSAPAQDYELTGSTSEDQQVSVCIFERQTKRSAWIPVGGNVDGIHVISFDNNHDTAVLMISGQRKEVSMRKPSIAKSPGVFAATERPVFTANSPASPIAAAPEPPPAAMTAPEQEQREARMLVSDLLEIGVQQRKAYQDAKLKAASGQPPAPGN